ncbi:MAG TPA: HEAT repeat domain-containing protein, partial [Candidatus Saccharimonadales bacterium]|nr:HEAT repeat domain-containing protein [Candidatus Saccharimonadales bacterium]
ILRGSARKTHASTLSAGLGLLGAFGDTSSAPLILRLAGPGYPEAVRREALLAVGAALKGTTLSSKVLGGIFALLTDKVSQTLTTTALEVLYRMELPKGAATQLIRLLDARDPAVRRFAARKLGNIGGIRAARKLVELLGDPDPSLRDAVADSLSRMPESVTLLMDDLDHQTDVHRAWAVAHILKNHAQKIPKPMLRDHIKRTVDLLLRGERIAEPWMHVARHAGPKLLYSALMSRAGRLKKARRYEDVEAVLRPLLRTEQFDTNARFELALASLRATANVEGVSPRSPDSPLDLFKQLARDPSFPFMQRIRKERNHLDSEDLYWVGFHLAEGTGEEKSIGAELLKMVAQKEGKSKLGRNARNKLRLEGLNA